MRRAGQRIPLRGWKGKREKKGHNYILTKMYFEGISLYF